MCAKARKDPRFKVLGRVEPCEFSALSGSLIDISLHGCRLHYDFPVTVDLESDYTIVVRIAHNSITGDLNLLCHPAWASEDSGSTDIGMTIMRSLDTDRLTSFVNELEIERKKENSISDQIVDTECQFV